MTKPKTNSDWLRYIGCCAWVNSKDGFFEVHPNLYPHSQVPGSSGPVWRVVGQEGRQLLVSTDGLQVSQTPKKFVRIIEAVGA